MMKSTKFSPRWWGGPCAWWSSTAPGTNRSGRQRIKALEREVREPRQANEILRKASAYFAQAELDRRLRS